MGRVCALPGQIGGHVEVEVDELSFTRQDGYDVIRWSGGTDKTQEIGAPELPVIFKTYVVPLEARVTGVEVSSSNRMAVKGNFTPYPVQPAVPTDGTHEVRFTQPKVSIYQGTEVYPQAKAQIVADYNEMGYHLVTVQLNPVEFDPVSRKLFASRLDFTLQYEMTASNAVHPLQQTTRRANIIKKAIRTMVDNPEDVDGFMNRKVELVGVAMPDAQTLAASSSLPINVIQEQIPDYIIICIFRSIPVHIPVAYKA